MRRREFVGLLGGVAAWPLAARAQQPERMRRIGVLLGNREDDPQAQAGLVAFRKALQDLGWTEGRNIRVDYRWGAADVGRIQALAKELVDLQPDLIVGQSTPVITALQRETKTIPIVFIVVSDPVGSGFVTSFPRPGGNITGFVNVEASLSSKWVEILRDIVPGLRRCALMFNPETAPYFAYYVQPFEAGARAHAVEPIAAPVRNTADIERVIESLRGASDAGLALMTDNFLATKSNQELVRSLTANYRVPTIYPYRSWVAAGGLISYGVDLIDLYRRGPTYVDRILKGAKVADLPVQLPTKFELAINLKASKSIGITIPPTLLSSADEVIE